MDRDEVWRAIAAERRSLADLLERLPPDEWDRPSLCTAWRVRDVAAHLTLAPTTGLLAGTVEMVRARGSFHRMVRDSARRKGAQPVRCLIDDLRRTADSRRLPPGTNHLNTLFDVLIHGQDIAVALGQQRPMPLTAASTAAERIWTMGWPFHARRRFAGFRLTATDATWSRGAGPAVEGPVDALLLLMTGRTAASLPRLSGDGAAQLGERLAPGPARRA
jgi:uncharacterized protein (TIGR03083 family)